MVATIGLEIGGNAVRAAQLTIGTKGPARLDRLGEVVLPAGAMRDGEVVDPGLVAEAIRSLWSRYGFRGRQVAMGLANQQVVVRPLELPYLPESELRQGLAYQVQDAIPIAVDQAILDFFVLDEFENADGQRFSRILLVAAQRVMVEAFVHVARLVKLEPVLMDLDAFAMLRSLAPDRAVPDPATELLCDIGADVTNLVVHQAGIPRFVRILLMGAGAGARLAEEIRGSLDYYAAQLESVPVERVVVCGGASQEPGLVDHLGATVQLPVDFGFPMQELQIGKVELSHDQLVEAQPRFAVAIGLALGAAGR